MCKSLHEGRSRLSLEVAREGILTLAATKESWDSEQVGLESQGIGIGRYENTSLKSPPFISLSSCSSLTPLAERSTCSATFLTEL